MASASRKSIRRCNPHKALDADRLRATINMGKQQGYYRGCLVGLACGDALGASVESMDRKSIFDTYGPSGIQELGTAYGVTQDVTDDIQMTLFTAGGLISSVLTYLTESSEDIAFNADSVVPAVHQAYLRWLSTQGVRSSSALFQLVKDDDWMTKHTELYSRQAPGLPCTRALLTGGAGTMNSSMNDMKGCGSVMRAAPCGLIVHSAFPFLSRDEQANLAFQLGCGAAAITHCHPSRRLSSGCLSALILLILLGDSLEDAVATTTKLLEKQPRSEETLQNLEDARRLSRKFIEATSSDRNLNEPTKQMLVLEHIKELGEGWMGEEALAIAVYSCLISPKNFETAICYAVSHGCDSENGGAIAGSIMGTLLGEERIPMRWKQRLELVDEIREDSDDLLHIQDRLECEKLRFKYPPPLMRNYCNNFYDLPSYLHTQTTTSSKVKTPSPPPSYFSHYKPTWV